MAIFLPLLVCLIGAVIVLVTYPTQNRWTEIGRAMLWMGMVSFLLQFHGQPFIISR